MSWLYYLYMTGLYSAGVFLGFLLLPFLRSSTFDEQEGIDLDKKYDRLFAEFSLVQELEEAPDSALSEEELLALRDKTLHYDIPHVNLHVTLFYNHETQSFDYYAPSSIIHKYLNVAARRYVIDYGCKQLYKDTSPAVARTESNETHGPFVARASKQFMEKEINQFHYLGNAYEIPQVKPIPKKVSFSEYLRQTKAETSCTLETQSTAKD